MSPLNIHPEEDRAVTKKKNNKVLKVLLGISALIAVPVIGTTLAATITISSGTVQFGQGIATAAACDSSIVVTPNASFVEADNQFKLGSVTITDLDATACASKTLKFRFYPTTGGADSALTVSSAGTTDATGVIAVPAIIAQKSQVRLVSEGSWERLEGKTGEKIISVVPSVSLNLPTSVKTAATYAVTGQVLPKVAGIKLTVKQNGKSLGEFITDTSGGVTFNIAPTATGLASYQVVIAAGEKNTAAISEEITILVR
jgi:hypothetical protein